MKVPFVSFKPMEKELDKDLRDIVWEQEMVLMH